MEVQIKGDRSNKRLRTVQVYCFFVFKTAHSLVRDVRKFVKINRKTGEKGADIHFIETEFQKNENIFSCKGTPLTGKFDPVDTTQCYS